MRTRRFRANKATSREDFYRRWIEAEVLPRLPPASSVNGLHIYYDAPLQPPSAVVVDRLSKEVPGLGRAKLYHTDLDGIRGRKLVVLEPSTDLELEAALAERKGVRAGLELVALVANPKVLELMGVYRLAPRSCLIGRPMVAGELDVGNPRRLIPMPGSSEYSYHSPDVIGIGYLGNPNGGSEGDRLVDGCVRAHCPSGVSIKEMAYGTCLYVGLACVAAVAFGKLCVGSAPSSDAYGPRLEDADKWWADNVQDRRGRPALAEEVQLDDLTESREAEEEEESGEYTLTRRQKRDIESDIESDIDLGYWDGVKDIQVQDELSYTYTLYRDEVETEEGVAGVLQLLNAIEQGLVVWISPDNKMSQNDWNHVDAAVSEAYTTHLDRFRNLNPNTQDPAILRLLREILIAGGIDPDDLADWEAKQGIGGTGYLFPPSARAHEVEYLDPFVEPLYAKGQPHSVRGFEQQALPMRGGGTVRTPERATPNRSRRATAEERLRAELVEPWLDDES